jgi:thiol-disulfide isomerase/thioredoxin
LAGFLLACQNAKVPNEVHLTIILPENMNGISVIYDGQLALLDNNYRVYDARQNQAGAWEVTIPLTAPQYFTLGRNPLYLTPGDSLIITYNADPAQSQIEGIGAEVNNFLRERFFVRGGSFLRSGRMVKPTLEEMVAALDSAAAHRKQELMALNAGDTFTRKELARIKANYANSLFYFPFYNSSVLFPDGNTDLTSEEHRERRRAYFDRIESIVMPLLEAISADDIYLDVEAVRMTMLHFYTEQFNDFHIPSERFHKLFAVANELRFVQGSMTREAYENFLTFGKNIETEEFRRVFMDRLERNSRFIEGMAAIDAVLIDLEGNRKKLSDYKGEILYVDIWATWCGPCRMESPHFRALSERYENIRFIAVSVDEQISTWESHQRDRDSGAVIHLWAESDIRRDWEIVEIPRFLLIDRDFTIITAGAPRPSQTEQITALLDKHN